MKPTHRIAIAQPLFLVITMLATFALGSTHASAQGWPPEIKNLKVLPGDTPLRELIGMMRGYTFALGVRCQHCHVGEEGQPLSEFDFATDEKPTKQRARAMLRMTAAINEQHLGKLGVEGGALTVECVTCHRGATRPEQLDDLILRTATEKGAEAAIAQYRSVREEHYGSGTFNFDQASLVKAAEALLALDKAEAAVGLLQLNLEHHPDSQWTEGTLAGAYETLDRKDEALAIWKKLLATSPDNPRFQQQVKRLTAPG